ncbi:unnamed protein product [Meganyctiphanes norvegica]|uniref:L-Fucosyltransferase n=1 Tax=Meganyctiphanes norvegica TaxID=48144 RepID=A0AAV2PWL0_MEGNR
MKYYSNSNKLTSFTIMSNHPIKSFVILLTLYTVLFTIINFNFYKPHHGNPVQAVANDGWRSLKFKKEIEIYMIDENNLLAKHFKAPNVTTNKPKLNKKITDQLLINNANFNDNTNNSQSIEPRTFQLSRHNVHNHIEGGSASRYLDNKSPQSGATEAISNNELGTESSGECHLIPQKKLKLTSLDECGIPWASVHHGGRLGNNICEYSALWILRQIYGIRVSIAGAMSSRLRRVFQDLSLPVKDKTCNRGPVRSLSYESFYKELYNAAQNYTEPMLQSVLSSSTYIWDHPCPSDLMMLYRDKLKKELVYLPHVMDAAHKQKETALDSLSRKHSSNNLTIITVHVRRNDRIRIYRKYYNISSYLSENYYYRAFDYFRNRLTTPVFLVMSDDPVWSKAYLSANDVIFAGSGDKKHPESDLALISLGHHHITSHGTFGFLGALLGHGTIVYPANFHNVTTKLEKNYACLPPHYQVIGIPAD